MSHCGSARTADLSSVYENEPASASNPPRHTEGYVHEANAISAISSKKKHRAFAAAFDSFATRTQADGDKQDSRPNEETPAKVSLDPREVFSAARHGRHKEVDNALAAGFDPAYMDSFGNSLFHVACQNGNKRIAKLAIKYGGDMDAQNSKGNTGVHFLFAYGYAEIGEYFIEKGASEDIRNDVNKAPREGIR